MVSAKRQQLDTRRFHLQLNGQLFSEQYYHIYNARLRCAREALIRTSRDRWGDEVQNVPLEQLNSSLGSTEVFVIGTLFKLMPKQPSILRELEENEQCPSGPDVNFTSDEDSLVLHETDENVSVIGDISVHLHVTGIPVSLRGYQLNDGAKFNVTDICYAGPNLSVYKMPSIDEYREKLSESNELLVIVSGLEFGFDSKTSKSQSENIISGLKKLRNFIIGNSGDEMNINSEGIGVGRVIIAGNSISPGYTKSKIELIGESEARDSRNLNDIFSLFDKYLYTIAQSGVDIDIMPGKNDPTSFLLPQQPFHPKIMPLSCSLRNVQPNTNPCLLEYKDLVILGTSGESIEAIRKYSRIEFSTTALKSTLEWGHIAPSAPDNLSCVPFKERDPFMIDFVPDIYFAGNQPEFAVTTYSTEVKSKIQLISVPSFVKTLSCVTVNLTNLEVELKSFN